MPRIAADVSKEEFHKFREIKGKIRGEDNRDTIFKLIKFYENNSESTEEPKSLCVPTEA